MRARKLMIPLVLICLASGCGGQDDDKGSSSSSSSSSASTGGQRENSGENSDRGSGETSSPGPGDSSTDRMTDDRGAPGDPDAKGRQTVLFGRVSGKTSDACAVVGGRRVVKSGGFLGGSFDDARKSYGKVRPGLERKQVRLYWVPQHAKPMGGVTVIATSAGKKVRVTQRSVADTEQWKFYDTLITLPRGGSWRFQVSSGADHGCFVASF